MSEEIQGVKIEIPEPICKICGKIINEGEPFCYECMLCDKCSPECFEEENE
ncbi:MAG: hypothetical protein ACOC3Z_02145 [Nanoarchaeota archaeon]